MTSISNVETVNFPFVANKNGIAVCRMVPSSPDSYSYVWDRSVEVGAGSTTSGAKYSFPFIVEKGKTYEIRSSSNVSSYTCKLI